jgi:hypothetical protein
MFEMATGLRAREGIGIEDAITKFHLVVPWAFSPRINFVAKAEPLSPPLPSFQAVAICY